MLDLHDELTAIAAALDGANVPYALVGGLAYSFWVETRATEDIDLLIAPEDWERVPAVLAPLGFRQLAAPMDFPTIRIRRLTKLAGADALVLDFLLADGPFRAGLERRVAIPRAGAAIQIAPPDVIIDLKRGRMSEKDKSDIAGLTKLIEGSRP